MAATTVYLEEGKTSVFAVALEWPGWCRRARTAELALEALDDYRSRYSKVVSGTFRPGTLEIIGSVSGTTTTDFGAPDARGPWDESAPTARELNRQIALLQDCWNYFDSVLASAPELLRKGPRGGGRDRDAVANHVREAERAYCSKVGFRVAPRTPWDEQRDVVMTTLRAQISSAKWPAAYAIRRCAWHVIDHAWEIEDKSA